MATYIKQETIQPTIDISDSDSETGSNDLTIYNIDGGVKKKQKIEVALPLGFLDPISKPNEVFVLHPTKVGESYESCKQFWKAGDYEGGNGGGSTSLTVGMDHLRVHPKFLHSNATSHKWALGALAELLDNALDEVCNGATYVHIDMLKNKKDNTKMLLVEDNGGGMTPDTMRQCMSLGYSVKSKLANTIGQYGNGFKTSTMRLGADVIVFSRNRGKDGRGPTQSIGLLSYTFLRRTGKEDIVVPMIDYEKRGEDWKMTVRSSPDHWKRNVETIVQWSPYASEDELLQQFDFLQDQGTRIVIYNLWEDDQGALELDFDTDYDIQIRGVNRDDTKIEMAKNYPNCRHFLTYRHSLRSYAAILYLSIPPSFRIILRGKDVDHHNLLDDMMLSQEIKYKPVAIADGTVNQNMLAVGTIGFVKDAKSHVDVQGFNVYHKNRLIKPFWRVWNAAGSDGRGVIGVLEANFVEPAHDKQGFERTNVLSKLEARLVAMQKNYWKSNCHLIGYAKRRNIKKSVSPEKGSNFGGAQQGCAPMGTITQQGCVSMGTTGQGCASMGTTGQGYASMGTSDQLTGSLCIQVAGTNGDGHAYAYADPITQIVPKLKEENLEPIQRPEQVDGLMMVDLLRDLKLERDRSNWFENEFQNAQKRIEEMDKDQVTIINVFSEERERRDKEEQSLRNLLKDAYDRIQGLINKVKLLESKSGVNCKIEP